MPATSPSVPPGGEGPQIAYRAATFLRGKVVSANRAWPACPCYFRVLTEICGLNRRAREGHLSAAHAHAIRQVLDRYADIHYIGIGFSHQIAARAKDLLEKHSLRAYDSVQLASALESNTVLIAGGLSALVGLRLCRQSAVSHGVLRGVGNR
ncbi:MAG: type II toxin-antitoxin system VapC family toxin [Anaerolineae bacterium]|nr:type II toxin-antitoxin system VapC family toxin [Anaerolineae bacterium]